MTFIAHINKETNKIQTCTDHCRKTAEYAADDLKEIGLKKTAYLAGLLHDCGKFTPEFNEYIQKAADGISVKKGSVIHTFAGVNYLMNKYHTADIPGFQELAAELISFSIGSHHGLFDCISEDSRNGFEHRLKKQPDYEKKAILNFTNECAKEREIDDLFAEACQEIAGMYSKFLQLPEIKNDGECQFYAGMMARLLTSAVINGDRKDTAEFMSGTDFSKSIPGNEQTWMEAHSALEQYISSFPSDSDIQKARSELSEYCRIFANRPSNIYRLNLPTGAGKTLSGLRYALTHAANYRKKRIFYIAPLISILDQNARIIRDAVDNEDLVLEHHSNVIIDEDQEEKLDRYQLLAETWDAPIIVTTLVQFMNTMFSGKTSCIRRMKSLCSSVIIIDEVQTVPTNMLTLFNLALNFLSVACNADILLCSATQPCLEEAAHPIRLSTEEAVPEDKWDEYLQIFKRTEIIDGGRMRLEDGIIPFILKLTDKYPSVLAVCNTKSEASSIFKILREQTEIPCYHLSSGMCMAHRRKILYQMENDLKQGKRLICISTQVIEAGVDISFAAGIRVTAGLDSIIQTAGRINRNGECSEPAPVYVIGFIGEKLDSLREIREARDASYELLAEYDNDPTIFQNDLSSKESADFYYKTLYKCMKIGQQDFPLSKKSSLFDLLSENKIAVQFVKTEEKGRYFMHQSFAEAGKLFKVMDEDTETLLVPYGNGLEIIGELSSGEAEFNYAYRKELLRNAKEFSVNVYKYQLDKLEKAEAIRKICDGSVLVLCNEAFYDSESLGLDPEGGSGRCSIQIL